MSPGGGVLGIAAGPDGNLWFTESDGGRVGRVTPQGVITEFRTGITRGSDPTGITSGPDGSLWFTETAGGRIGRITTGGVVREYPLGSASGGARSAPVGITTGPDGDLWFTERAGNRIGRMTSHGGLTWFRSGITAGSGLAGIATGPDGNLWFAERDKGRIGRITTAGAVTQFRVGARARPSAIVAGPDGNLWFTETYGNHIGRITPQGTLTWFRPANPPTGIAAGADGNLWFTETFGAVGRITPQGAITEFSKGLTVRSSPAGPRSSPSGIAAGPDGNLWFTETVGDRIGRITPSGVISEYPPTGVLGNARLRGTRAAVVPVRCPSGAAGACGGRLILLDARGLPPETLYQRRARDLRRGRLGVSRINVAPGHGTQVAVALWAAARRRLLAQGTLQLEVVLAPASGSTAAAVSRRAVLATPATSSTLAGSWRRLPAPPLPKGLTAMTAIWTGQRMIVTGSPSYGRNVAAAYAPATNTWRRIAQPPRGLPGRSAWTGRAIITAGLPNVSYDAATGRWSTLPRAGLSPTAGILVWTGREVIGWGGGCCGESSNAGSAYNPATGSARKLAAAPLAARQQLMGAWTGTELVVAGGADANGHVFRTAAAYDPRTGAWRRIAPLPEPRTDALAVWTGRELLVLGGKRASGGVAYDPVGNQWRRLPRMEAGRWDTGDATAVWTGRRLLVWGGRTILGTPGEPQGLDYNPATNRWSALSPSPLRGPASPTTGVWTGRQFIVWNGAAAAAFTPSTPRAGTSAAPFVTLTLTAVETAFHRTATGFVQTDNLFRGTRKVGTDRAVCVLTSPTRASCTMRLVLAGGALRLRLTLTSARHRAGVLTVTGGSGAYRGARGSGRFRNLNAAGTRTRITLHLRLPGRSTAAPPGRVG